MSDVDKDQGKQRGLLPDPIGEDGIVQKQDDGNAGKDAVRRGNELLDGVEAVDPEKIKHDGP